MSARAEGVAVALLSGLVARVTILREDASLAAFYLISLAVGVVLVSVRGSNLDLLHVLFGTVLALDDGALLLIGTVATVTLFGLAVLLRPLALEWYDPGYLRSVSRAGPWVHLGFLGLVVLNLVGAFHALGTLMAVGLMMLPAAAARFWARELTGLILLAVLFGATSGAVGLLLSCHLALPSGPAIVLTAGAFYLVSLAFGPTGSLLERYRPRRHLEA